MDIYAKYKINNEKTIVIIKSGSFYRTYENDALIIWKIFGYNLNNNIICFPASVFLKVVNKLNRIGLNIIVYKEDGFINYCSDKGNNEYDNILSKSLESYEFYKRNEVLKEKINEKVLENKTNYEKIDNYVKNL